MLDDPHALEFVLFLSNLGQVPLPYDLLLIDLRLETRELDLLARLQEQVRSGHLSLIVLTSSEQHAIERASDSFPTLHFVQKPFHLIHLLSLIETASSEEESGLRETL